MIVEDQHQKVRIQALTITIPLQHAVIELASEFRIFTKESCDTYGFIPGRNKVQFLSTA